MKAAIVRGPAQTPVYGDFAEPVPSSGENRVKVAAAAISHVVKSRASGRHYSAADAFPFAVGIDGVGKLDDGSRVYFVLPKVPTAAWRSKLWYLRRSACRCPDALDNITAAAIANPGVSSWAAYTERARLKAGETVLVNGATGTAGRLAVQIARHLGAGKVIATGRDAGALRSVAALGADVTIPLIENTAALEDSFKEQFAAGVDVVIDYLWGNSAECLLIAGAKAGQDAVPIRFVQIGSASGSEINLPSAVLRSSAIELMGSGIGSIPLDRLVNAVGGLLQAAVPGGFKIATTTVPLSDVEAAWPRDDSRASHGVHHRPVTARRRGTAFPSVGS